MSKKREPIETQLSSSVVFPSGIFALERDESWPYERFAYNVLDVGVHALHKMGLPESLTVDFACAPLHSSAWAINSSVYVKKDGDGDPLSFCISTPELTPALFYLFANTVAQDFFKNEVFRTYMDKPNRLRESIQKFANGANAAIRAYRTNGLGAAIRAGYDYLGLAIMDVEKTFDTYDLLTKQIAYHEVAHAYAGHVLRHPVPNAVDSRAYELIADLIGTVWFFEIMVYYTPDTPEYREFRGFSSYAECIFENALMVYRAQQANLVLAALAGAQREGGRVSLEGGLSHPPGLQRYMLQHMTLSNLVMSNFKDKLTEPQQEALEGDWRAKMEVLSQSGIMPSLDVFTGLDPRECDAVERAAELIESEKIPEVQNITSFLRSMRDNLEKLTNSRGE